MAGIEEYLQGLEDQKFQETRQIVVVSNTIVKEICEKYNVWLNRQTDSWYAKDLYDHALLSIDCLIYSARDVRVFSLIMKKYEQHNSFFLSGSFLSALINNCKEEDFEICTEHFSKKIRFLGMWNSKQVMVSGNLEMYTGIFMSGGFLEVKGSVENDLGRRMSGGSIKVNGCAGYGIGTDSNGGEIHIEGKIGTINKSICKARIYHKGELVWPK